MESKYKNKIILLEKETSFLVFHAVTPTRYASQHIFLAQIFNEFFRLVHEYPANNIRMTQICFFVDLCFFIDQCLFYLRPPWVACECDEPIKSVK